MDSEYLKQFEIKVAEQLLQIATEKGALAGEIYVVDELDDAWKAMAPYYMADAVPNIATHPNVALAWAGYLGMGAAAIWDKDWSEETDLELLYKQLVDPRGFDAMDDYVCDVLYGLAPDSDDRKELDNLWRTMADKANALIKNEQVEPQTEEAFHIFARTVKVIYILGYSIGLHGIGYRLQKVDIPLPKDQLPS